MRRSLRNILLAQFIIYHIVGITWFTVGFQKGWLIVTAKTNIKRVWPVEKAIAFSTSAPPGFVVVFWIVFGMLILIAIGFLFFVKSEKHAVK